MVFLSFLRTEKREGFIAGRIHILSAVGKHALRGAGGWRYLLRKVGESVITTVLVADVW